MTRATLAGLAAVLLCGAGVHAHHAISAIYDAARPVNLDGVVTAFHYVNPHPFVEVQVPSVDGPGEAWRLELDNLSELAAVGMSADTFKAGDRVLVTASRARDGSRRAYVRSLQRRADGFLYEQIGSSPRVRRGR